MKVLFVAGFGPITPNPEASRALYVDALGLPLAGDENEPEYIHSDAIEGTRYFSVWPLAQAAQACFGKSDWPDDLPVPQAGIEFEVDDVPAAAAELEAKGYRLIVPAKVEPWGQSVARLISPEGLLVGVTHTPWMHPNEAPPAA